MADVLVIGADRGLGAAVAGAARAGGYAVAACARETIADAGQDDCDRLVAELRPRAVIDCGAPALPLAVCMARAASRAGALSVITSGVEVFDGALDRPYVESDVPMPSTPGGLERLEVERAVARENGRHVIVRTSWVLGLTGPPLEALVAAGSAAGEVAVGRRLRGTPMLTGDVADALVALLHGGRYGVFHPGGGDSCTALELTRVVFRALGLDARVVPALEPGGHRRQEALDTRRPGGPRVRDWRLAAAAFAHTLRHGSGRGALSVS